RLLVESVSDSRMRREDGYRDVVAHRRQAGDEDLAGMAAGVEQVVLVLLAGRDVGLGGGGIGLSGAGARAVFSAVAAASDERGRGEGDRRLGGENGGSCFHGADRGFSIGG